MSRRSPGCHVRDQALGGGDHGRAVGGDAAAVEGRLHQAPLPQPEVAFAGEQAVAEDERVEPQGEVLDEVVVLRDEDFFDEVGMADQVDAAMAEAERERRRRSSRGDSAKKPSRLSRK